MNANKKPKKQPCDIQGCLHHAYRLRENSFNSRSDAVHRIRRLEPAHDVAIPIDQEFREVPLHGVAEQPFRCLVRYDGLQQSVASIRLT
jgi:hypothetical protein